MDLLLCDQLVVWLERKMYIDYCIIVKLDQSTVTVSSEPQNMLNHGNIITFMLKKIQAVIKQKVSRFYHLAL